jgi:hypothetical protein
VPLTGHLGAAAWRTLTALNLAAWGIAVLQSQMARAGEAREDYFLWEDLDKAEASAELERYVARLERLLRANAPCFSDELGLGMRESAERMLAGARHMREARAISGR